jgi:hypothetical protein
MQHGRGRDPQRLGMVLHLLVREQAAGALDEDVKEAPRAGQGQELPEQLHESQLGHRTRQAFGQWCQPATLAQCGRAILEHDLNSAMIVPHPDVDSVELLLDHRALGEHSPRRLDVEKGVA